MSSRRTALLVRCSKQEAEAIREAARLERRTMSAFVLNAVLTRIEYQRKFQAGGPQRGKGAPGGSR